MPTLTKKDLGIVRTLAAIANPKSWPYWPVLPVCRYHGDRTMPECAIVLDTRAMGITGFSSAVFFLNAFALPNLSVVILTETTREVYDDAEELVAAGWRID